MKDELIDKVIAELRPKTDKVITLNVAKDYIKAYGGHIRQNIVNKDEVFWCSLFSSTGREIAKFPAVPELNIDYETYVKNQTKRGFVDGARRSFRAKFTDSEWHKMCCSHY